jgi:hypothetical protein
MPTSAEPLVRAALDALRRQVESQLYGRRNLITLDEALAARDRTEAEQATTMGPSAQGWKPSHRCCHDLRCHTMPTMTRSSRWVPRGVFFVFIESSAFA